MADRRGIGTGSPPGGALIERARRIYELFNSEPEAVLELLDPDFEYVNPDDAVEPGTRRGHDGMTRVFGELRRVFDDFSHEPAEFESSGDRVLVRVTFRARGRESGAVVQHEETHVWTFRDGLATRLEWFREFGQALEAAGMKR